MFEYFSYSDRLLYSRYDVPMVPLALVPHLKLPYNIWENTIAPYRHHDNIVGPPPQSMFLHAGGPQRRHFSVAPDWRRINHH